MTFVITFIIGFVVGYILKRRHLRRMYEPTAMDLRIRQSVVNHDDEEAMRQLFESCHEEDRSKRV